MEGNRREFLKRSAVAGGLVWAAPVISTITATPARAASPVCACTGGGFGLSAEVHPVIGPTVTVGPVTGCVDVDTAVVDATVVCSAFDPATCTATASVATLAVGGTALTATVLASNAHVDATPGSCTFSGNATIASLTVGGSGVTVTGAANQSVNVTVGIVQVVGVINEQVCEGNVFVVRALNVAVAVAGVATTNVIVAESRVASPCCPSCP